MKFKVMFYEHSQAAEQKTTLPFVPFIGLQVQCAWAGGDFRTIEAVFWDAKRKTFDCFMEDHEDDE
jgi:hypothetical protein